jgi:hypothetical protein
VCARAPGPCHESVSARSGDDDVDDDAPRCFAFKLRGSDLALRGEGEKMTTRTEKSVIRYTCLPLL